ncbi:MAG: pirin family protein [Chitinophagaceae bacterium]|nr:MAG: pirin family protein [Chitinophagaceae bacterium]
MSTDNRSVKHVFIPPDPHMVGDGFRVHSFFPGNPVMDKKRMSPFYLMDYNAKIDFSASDHQRGVGVHPHRGFETVTIAYHGRIAHHDSAGNSGVIGEGDVQWMTAASGLLHKEYHEESFSRDGGLFQMVQLWVNLPAKDKMGTPKYQEIANSSITRVPVEGGSIEIIAGEYQGAKGPASTFTPMDVMNLRLQAGSTLQLDLPATWNTGLLVVEGSVKVNGIDAPLDHFVLMDNDGSRFTVTATEDTLVLLLSGEPIDEPIAQYGPFLMNKWEELEVAIRDVSTGKFGVLED